MQFHIKPAGLTINQYINKIKEETNYKKICFSGRLDPMARGEILILIGDECKNMNKYLNSKKTYEFEIIFGLQTDSDDPLGLLENINYNKTDEDVINKLKNLLKNKIMKFNQNFHYFSSKRINGKPLWYYKKNNIDIELPTHEVEIHSLQYDNIKEYNFEEWKNKIISQIDTIDKTKDFNQDIIIDQWKKLNIEKLISIPVKIHVSSGFYVRQFVRDLSNIINYPLLTYDINRIKINLN